MSLPVFLASVGGAVAGQSVTVTGEQARHAVVVRRIRTGEQVALTDGEGTTAVCAVTSTTDSTLRASVLELRTIPPASPRLVVAQAIAKGDRGERAVEMLTEIGVDVIIPWAASRSVAVWRGERAAKALARWRVTAREAAKQSRRSWFPRVAELATTSELTAVARAATLSVVLHEAAATPLASLEVPGRGDLCVVVGPEGGITEEEVGQFSAAGAAPVRLGSSVLRTSTAGVAAAAALLSRTSRWR